MALLGLLGGLLALVGCIWIAVIAFQNDEMAWGVISIFCILAALVYGIMHSEEAKIPLGMLVVGIILNIVGRVMLAGSGVTS